MKLIVRVWNISLILMLVSLIISSLVQKGVLQSELKGIVSDALVQTAQVMVDERYSIINEDELMAEFEQHLLRNIRITENMKVDIHFITSSIEEGVLSVIVEQKHPFLFFPNKTITVSSRQTILLDREEKEIIW